MSETIIGNSAATQDLLTLIGAIAPTEASVLITGESGAGKELVAQGIHDKSLRSAHPFVAVNCGAIPAELLESELFGHKKGSFTGAISDHVGRVQSAHAGTLFLDEIGDMPMAMQVKLLRVLQEKVVVPVGSNKPIHVDIRVVAATHRNLEEEIKAGRFRADLYYRINVVPVCVAPLRERREEVPALVEHFAKIFAADKNTTLALDGKFLRVMKAYDWPGNVRELSNMMHRLSVLHPGQRLSVQDVSPTMLPVGMSELACGVGDSEQSSLLDMMFDDEPPVAQSADIQRAGPAASGPQEHLSEADREFESIIMRAQGFDDFRQQGQSLKGILSDVEQDIIQRALSETDGNVSRCAKLLRMQRTTLIERIKKYDLKVVAA
ncbi:sigma-54 dependent transcriptional regulator [Pseudomonadales bacterium]|nr:sigma-54 dependent transcriptional regulator [Pseudomonadales bacterium]MDA8703421.1 sigma-54 dependent transcriptional regulator [Pseudomonadales bacterium]MDB0051103.1 sigma-54 dependent transcriptional regulator [Pseudomonadales bacterium]MDB2646357.1 sigma-54 dependent transcriptional regulator [Pseudomonadales bacterium]MDB9756665.1 sigma-54 dependent transcriptional regulator [Pseudomonadales bacterium]